MSLSMRGGGTWHYSKLGDRVDKIRWAGVLATYSDCVHQVRWCQEGYILHTRRLGESSMTYEESGRELSASGEDCSSALGLSLIHI